MMCPMQPMNPYAPPMSGPPVAPMLLPHPAELEMNMVLRGAPHELREGLRWVLESAGWNVQWALDGWSGMATKGNQVMNILFGAFAMYHELRFVFQAYADGSTGLTLYRQGSGCMGGLLGVYKVKKAFRETSAQVHAQLAQRGWVVASHGR